MVNFFRSFIIAMIGFIMIAAIFSYTSFALRDSTSSLTLQTSLQTSVMASNDKSARVDRGHFVIDLKKFQENLGETEVKEFNGKRPDYKIEILKDNNYNLDKNNEQYSSLYKTEIDSDNNQATTNFNEKLPRYVAVKAVRVVANFELSKSKSKDNGNKHIATFILQNTTTKDEDNDLTD